MTSRPPLAAASRFWASRCVPLALQPDAQHPADQRFQPPDGHRVHVPRRVRQAPGRTPTATDRTRAVPVSGRPMQRLPSAARGGPEADAAAASIQNRTFAFVPNSASGDLSVIDADNWKHRRSRHGDGRLRARSARLAARADLGQHDGCRLVSANRGSCDLTLVDPSALLAATFAAQYNSGPDVTIPAGNGLQRIVPRGANGRRSGRRLTRRCSSPGHRGTRHERQRSVRATAPRRATPWRALVTFPSCDLVALVDHAVGHHRRVGQGARRIHRPVIRPASRSSRT